MDTANSMRSAHAPFAPDGLRRPAPLLQWGNTKNSAPIAPSCCYYSGDAYAFSMTSPPPSYAGSAPSAFHFQPTGRNFPSPTRPLETTNPCSASEYPPAAPSVDRSLAELSYPDTPQTAIPDSPQA